MPSACGAATSARCFTSARTFTQSAFSAALASTASAPNARTLIRQRTTAMHTPFTSPSHRQQFVDASLAVGERVEPDADALEQREVQVGKRRRLRVTDVTRGLVRP